jgi:hypothetical protein
MSLSDSMSVYVPLNRRSLSEFPTTLTELKAIAALAITGLSIPAAASGIPITL